MIAAGIGGDHLLLVVVGLIVAARIGFRVVRPRRRRAPENRESDRRPARSAVSAELADHANQTPLEPVTAADGDHPSESSGEFATLGASALEIKDLRVSYGPKRAVAGVSLVINEGEIFGLLGPNGAGKTTTLSAIEGLLRPDAGTILVGGVDSRSDPLGAKSRLGVQLQSTGFPAALTIREIVRLYAGLYGLPLSISEQRELLASVGLDDEATKRFAQLSGGQQQ
ncbi:MAG: ATP-binding cassette domain-containing protein, partial [Thermoleophilia bacterium]